MTILLQWLIEHAWILYAACAVGGVVYLARALMAQREQRLSVFTLERETATSKMVQAWAMVLVFVALGIVIFFSATIILPGLPFLDSVFPAPTLVAGLASPTPSITPVPSPTPESTGSHETPTSGPVPTFPPPNTPTPAPTSPPTGAVSGEVSVRFGNFAELTGYSVSAAEITTAQPLQLTLTWRALDGVSPIDYLVFTHLIRDDGTLVAQHDGAPAGGTRPVTGWAPGETIEDLHVMEFQDSAYVGTAQLQVGLYDPATGRVLTGTGDDRAILPVAISIVPSQ